MTEYEQAKSDRNRAQVESEREQWVEGLRQQLAGLSDADLEDVASAISSKAPTWLPWREGEQRHEVEARLLADPARLDEVING